MKMNIHRAQELIVPLRNGTAEGISQHWQARLIEALEYVIENEAAQQSVKRTAEKRCWCGLLIKDDGVCVNGHPQPPAANASR